MLEQIYVSAIPQFDFLKPTSLLKVWRTKIFLSSTLFFVQVFNRDEPDREKKIHVTVKASDSGKPPLEDVCTIAVTIKDVNDNPPRFIKRRYKATIVDNIPYYPDPSPIIQLLAEDDDIGSNGELFFYILNGNEQEQFFIDPSKGIIYPNTSFVGQK